MNLNITKRTSRYAVISAILILQGACATLLKGPNQLVNIDSNVHGADVLVNEQFVGKTPFNAPIPRGSATRVTVKKSGFESRTITLNTEVEGAFWANILTGGLIGSSTDSASGAMLKYSPAAFQIDLLSAPETAPAHLALAAPIAPSPMVPAPALVDPIAPK
jgi:hypothetical protein